MRRSEKWDLDEKDLGDIVDSLQDLPFSAKKLMLEALDIYIAHSKTCHFVKVVVSETKIKKLECVDCGWQFQKPWWVFW